MHRPGRCSIRQVTLESPEVVIVVAVRGRATEPLRAFVDQLTISGRQVLFAADVPAAATALISYPTAVAVVDVNDLTLTTEACAAIAELLELVPDAAIVAAADQPSTEQVIACVRAGAGDFVAIGAHWFAVTTERLAEAAGRRLRASGQRRAVAQLRAMVERMLKDLVRTERRTIVLEDRLARRGRDTPDPGHDDRAPVVLVIEDDRDLADYLCDALEAQAVATYAFVTGEEALAHAARMATRHQPIDLVVIDLGLPGIDGLELIRRLRADRPDLAVVIITGFADETRTEQAAELEVLAVLLKPFDDPQAVATRIQAEAMAAMTRARDQQYLERIKARHDKVLTLYRRLLNDLPR